MFEHVVSFLANVVKCCRMMQNLEISHKAVTIEPETETFGAETPAAAPAVAAPAEVAPAAAPVKVKKIEKI